MLARSAEAARPSNTRCRPLSPGSAGPRITDRSTDLLPSPRRAAKATVGLLMMRSMCWPATRRITTRVIRALEARGLRVIPAFAGGLDGRPAIDAYFAKTANAIDAMVSLTGFLAWSAGRPTTTTRPPIETLKELDVPYIAAHPLEFQTLGQWAASTRRPGAGRDHDAGRAARAGRRDQPHRVRPAAMGRMGATAAPYTNACRSSAKAMAPCLSGSTAGCAGSTALRFGEAAPQKVAERKVGHRALWLPAQCGRGGHGGLSVGL